MREITKAELPNYINEKIIMKSESQQAPSEVIIKNIKGEVIWGINKSHNSLFELNSLANVKFYEP